MHAVAGIPAPLVRHYGFDRHYASAPSWDIYAGMLEVTTLIWRDLHDLQSFIRVRGSDDYEE